MQRFRALFQSTYITMRNSQTGRKFRRVSKVLFSEKYLLYTNITISMSLSSLGDVIEQNYEILYTKELEKWDTERTGHMAFSGMGVGAMCHYWYKFLDRIIHGRTVKNVFKKLILDQMICSPIMIMMFFASVSIFEEKPIEDFTEEMRDKFWTLYKAEWVIWPPAQIINFFFLPTRFRVLYDSTISLGYDIYTSKVKHEKTLKQGTDNLEKEALKECIETKS